VIFSAIDDQLIDELEAVLFTSDIGARTADRLLEDLKMRRKTEGLKTPQEVIESLRNQISKILDLPSSGLFEGLQPGKTKVVMVVGVNGVGKTTSIGKLAHGARQRGHSVLLGAGDTFRAAAVEQLEVWAERSECEFVHGADGVDPSSVLFDAVKKGVEQNMELVICDTAGRLHTRAELMDELKKMYRVIGKAAEGAPHEVILVLDATIGQNAIAQARTFVDAVPVTGIILTKLDGTARGGVIAGICDELKIPVRYIGVGEGLDDLRGFVAADFVDALFDSVLETA
jgi:fused signal recognition particle receptor